MVRSCLLLVAILLPTLTFSQARRALTHIEKLKYDQAQELLYKSISKDSLNAGEKYVLSILYFTEDYYYYSIDSAYYFVVEAISDYEKSDEKSIEKLTKDEIRKTDLTNQKNILEGVIFNITKSTNTEQSYIGYLDKYPTSLLYDSAIWYRNKVAFEDATGVDDWESYKIYIDKYPRSEQYEEAKSRYQKLIYLDKTEDGKLLSYETFLSEFPETPYRQELEKAIFDISTGTHRSEDYSAFITKFPNSQLNKLAEARIYHILKGTDLMANNSQLIYKYHSQDSIKRLEEMESQFLFPVLKNSTFQLLNKEGKRSMDISIDYIPELYKCASISGDVILISREGVTRIINHAGTEIYTDEEISFIEDLGSGFVAFEKGGKKGLIFKTGELVIPASTNQIKILQDQYIAYEVNGLWGITSINKIQLTEPRFSNIDSFKSLIRLYDAEEKFALIKPENLAPILDKAEFSPDFHYDDVEVLSDGLILTYSGDRQGIITFELETSLDEEEQEIISTDKGLFVETNEGFKFLTDRFDINPVLYWEDIDFNQAWITLKGPNGWTLLSAIEEKVIEEYIDSVRLLNRSTVLSYKNGIRTLFFSTGNHIDLKSKSSFEVVSSPPVDNSQAAYYTLIKERDSKWLLDGSGDTLLVDYFSEVRAFGEEYLVVSGRNGSGLFDSDGHLLLKPEFDGIANYKDGSLTILRDGKLGYYRLADSTFIPPDYMKSIRPYGDTLFIAYAQGGYGIIDGKEKRLTEFIYEDMDYFNDSSAWVKKDELWHLLNISKGVSVHSDVTNYYPILNTNDDFYYYQTSNGKGVLNRKTGTIINATFNEIVNIGPEDHPIFMAEKFVKEADYFVIVYYGPNGNILFRQGYTDEEYEDLICEN